MTYQLPFCKKELLLERSWPVYTENHSVFTAAYKFIGDWQWTQLLSLGEWLRCVAEYWECRRP